MAALDTPGADLSDVAEAGVVRLLRWAYRRLRPWLGWLPLLLLTLINVLAATSIDNAGWVREESSARTLVTVALLAAPAVWAIAGWARPPTVVRLRAASVVATAIVIALLGLLLVSLLVMRWLPPADIWLQAMGESTWAPLAAHAAGALAGYAARASLWWQGVQTGGAPTDEAIFVAFAGAALWLAGAGGAGLLRATRQGLAGALPALALLGSVVFLSGAGRPLFITALALALALHVAADNQRLEERWVRQRLDYSGDLFLERWFSAAGLAAIALAAAAVAPVVSVQSIADFYARLMAPVDERLAGVRRTTFPNVELRPRLAVAGSVTGLPNDFLLGAGPELSQEMILTLRTSDGGGLEEPDEAPYLRALLLDIYTGRGWEQAAPADQLELPAAARLAVDLGGRRMLAQTVRLHRPSSTWYVAGEAVEFGADAWVRVDTQGQFITAGGSPTTFTALSAVAALDEATLAALPPWSAAQPLPPGFDAYLALPASVTTRTRALAQQLTAGLDTPYLQAQALERYLRTIPYDLDIPAPPEGVQDVADWFLFDLQRGYCDYYATAFVVMARSLGLPARFVVGYAPGNWMSYEQAWQVTAAQSHAWPEVYLPQIGWLPFEPTAYRSLIERRGNADAPVRAAAPPVAPAVPPPAEPSWTWQMLVWLLPLAGVVWGAYSLWRRAINRRADPWQALEAWGARVGRPAGAGETPHEYADALARLAEGWAAAPPGRGADLRSVARTAAGETRALGAAAATVHYASPASRAAGAQAVQTHWHRLQPLLTPLARRFRPRRANRPF